VPPDSTLEFEVEVLNACQPIEKETLQETDSNVTPKESDYVRINMVVKAQDGTVRDGYFEKRPLEFYMKDHTGKSEPTGKWKPGNIIKKCVENMRLHEKAKFVIKEEVSDKHGNKPFWGTGAMVLELTLNTIGADEDVTGDQGVMKHRVSEGEGYEKPTDGAKVTFHVRVMPGSSAFQGGIREGGGEEEGKTEDGEKTREEEKKGEGKRVDYSKWDKLEVTDDGEVVQKVPPSAEKALAEAKAAQEKREAAGQVLLSTFETGGQPWTIHCGYGETAEGLEDAIMTMKKGERSLIRVRGDYGFAAHDKEAPIKELAVQDTLCYEVLVISIDKGREHWNLDGAGKLKWGTEKRLRGNDFFKTNNFRRALKLYQPLVSSFFMKMPQRPSAAAKDATKGGQQFKGEKIMNIAPHLKPAEQSEDSAEERELKLALQLPSLLNIAACHMKKGNNRHAIEACEKALKLEEGSVKALFRRGKALAALCEYDKAKKDFDAVLQADPTNADAKQQLALIASELKKAKATQQKAFSSFFASSPSSEPADAEAQSQPANKDSAAATLVYTAPEEEGDYDAEGRPRARVTAVRKYALPQKDVAPKVRIAGMVGGGGDSGDDGDE